MHCAGMLLERVGRVFHYYSNRSIFPSYVVTIQGHGNRWTLGGFIHVIVVQLGLVRSSVYHELIFVSYSYGPAKRFLKKMSAIFEIQQKLCKSIKGRVLSRLT